MLNIMEFHRKASHCTTFGHPVYPRLVAGGNANIFDFFAFGLFQDIMKHLSLRSWFSEIALEEKIKFYRENTLRHLRRRWAFKDKWDYNESFCILTNFVAASK